MIYTYRVVRSRLVPKEVVSTKLDLILCKNFIKSAMIKQASPAVLLAEKKDLPKFSLEYGKQKRATVECLYPQLRIGK